MRPVNGHLVVFSPSGKRGRVAAGATVLGAARSLGVDLDSVCGGRAICGRCRIEVAEGEMPKHGIVSRAENLESATAAELLYGKSHPALPAGSRLGCQARICGDVAIDVPAASQVHHQVVRKPHEDHDIVIDPVVQPYFVEVAEPDMHDPSGDLERLCAALAREWGLENLSCALPALVSLQPALREGGWSVTVAVREGCEIVAVWAGFREELYGLAVDVGSTTIAAHLCALGSGEVLASAGRMNPQIRFGEDLMSRVSYIMLNPGGEAELTRVVRAAVSELAAEVAASANVSATDIVEMTVVGNPVMQHLLLGLNPVELGTAPFTLASDSARSVPAAQLGIAIHPGGYVYALPCIAGHVGADAAAVL
ncbi:MAG TPA: 2Fe-2S iron-sulfur cluster-binding protein, partial [Xanthomonadales bacterium]|nr:2Fe-2S iron-sulfur cluster-binding protein [Xanthomonadales bacterium]